MKITIRKPIGYSHIGRKDQQEDAVWPLFSDVTADNRCIVLCDGVGGSEHGEVASQTSSKIIGEYLTEILAKSDYVCDEDVQEAVNLAYNELERIDADNADSGKVSMATTLTCVCFHKDGILAAHMGDSRIYHIRPKEGLKYQSDDHSLVNALLKAGELTPEEAENFPRKNVITKAIQPHTERRFNAEVHQLTDVQNGDYLFLCCDGVLEQVTNDRLVEVLSMDCSDEEKLAMLEAESMDKTRDNFTAYLIPIDTVEGESTIVHDDEIATVVVEENLPPAPNHRFQREMIHLEPTRQRVTESTAPLPQRETKSKKRIVLFSVIALVVLSLMFFMGRCSSKGGNLTPKELQQLYGVKQEVPKQKADSSAKEKQDPNKRKPVTTPLDKLEKQGKQ